MIVGVISDTHGLLRPEVLPHLEDCRHIIHAGDVGDPAILEKLGAIGQVHAVRGNIDKGEWTSALPEMQWVTLAEKNICVIHDLNKLDIDPKAASLSVVISGHTHKPHKEIRDEILFLNPGSIGPRRFSLPISMAKLHLNETKIEVEFVELG